MAKKKISKKSAKRKPRAPSTRGKGAAKKTNKKKAKTSKKVSKKAPAAERDGAKQRTAIPADPPAGPAERAELLVALGERAFPDLTTTERNVILSAAHGTMCDVAREGDETFPNGAEWGCWETWPTYRSVRGAVIRWLCMEPAATTLIDARGIRILNARITGTLTLDDGYIAIDIADASVPVVLVLRACALPDTLVLERAKLRELNLAFSRCGEVHACGVLVDGDIRLNNVICKGKMDLHDAEIRGNLICRSGSFAWARNWHNEATEHQTSLDADRIKIGANAWLNRGFSADGEVRLRHAKIGGSLYCTGGSFAYARDGDGKPIGNSYSLSADSIIVGGGVRLDYNFSANGMVRMIRAQISGDLVCTGGSFACARNSNGETIGHPCSFSAQRMRVGGFSFLRGAAFAAEEMLDLNAAHLGHLNDNETSWPNHIDLTATAYDNIDPQSPLDSSSRLEWLSRHDCAMKHFGQSGFDPQPYHQLASVLRKQGHDKWADQIMEKAGWKRINPAFQERWNNGETWLKRWLSRGGACVVWVWRWILGLVVGHGYDRIRPLAWIVGFVVIGWFVFTMDVQSPPLDRRMQPTQSLALKEWHNRGYAKTWVNKYPDYSPLGYSLDTFLPLVNLHQDQYWTPRTWWVKRLYLPFHVMSGWVVTTLFVVGFTGLVRQEKR